MPSKQLSRLARYMKQIDFCMMNTVDGRNILYSRPMSNNSDVEFDGDCWFFTYKSSRKVRQIKNHPSVTLNYVGADMTFISLAGKAEVHTDKALLEEHWHPSLKMWFKDGVETKGICLIKVSAKTAHCWTKKEEFVVTL